LREAVNRLTAKHSSFCLRVFLNQLVLLALAFFSRGLLAKKRKLFQQIGNLALISRLPQSLDQMIKRGLILRILLQCLPALLDGLRVFLFLQKEFC